MRRIVVALGCGLIAACSPEQRRTAERRDVPVFIVSIDSVRADRLPVYGYKAAATPAIDDFRREAILFRWAFSNSPSTLPSTASILTGELPPVHGIRGDVGYRLSPDAGTLATALREMGYSTAAAVSSYVLRHETRVGEGFDVYDDRVGAASRAMLAERDGDETRLALSGWLSGVAGKRVYGFLHLNEPHAPHASPPGYDRTPDDYDNEIAYADAVFGRFLETLRTRGLYEDALIILLSDHGEGLGDHGEDEHGLFVYRESIHVPLLVKLPRGERGGETVSRATGLHELRDLVLDVIRGQRRSAVLKESSAPGGIYSESYYPRVHFGWRELRSLITPTRHFIDAATPELYAYRADPAETSNLAAAEPEVVKQLTAALGRIDSRFRPPTVTEDADAHLIAPQTETAVVDAAARPDAKEKVQIVRDLQRSLRFYEAGRYRDAIPLLERVVFSEPAIVEGWAMLGRSRAAAGQHALALEAYHEGLKRFPNNAELALLAANEYADAGNWAAAEEYARSVEANDPVVAHEALARFAARRGKLDTARQHAETVVRLAPGRVPTLMFLAELSRRSGRHADQLLWLDRAVREIAARDDQPFEGLHSARGQALAALGRIAEAEAAFRREMGQFPHNLAAWKDLAVLLGATGRRDAARQVLLSAIQANNTAEMRALARQAFAEIGDAGGMSFIESRIGTP